jgi:flagellar biosynthesis component FlhA
LHHERHAAERVRAAIAASPRPAIHVVAGSGTSFGSWAVSAKRQLRPSAYRITLKGVQVGTGVPGTATSDPAFGLPATWIYAGMRDEA